MYGDNGQGMNFCKGYEGLTRFLWFCSNSVLFGFTRICLWVFVSFKTVSEVLLSLRGFSKFRSNGYRIPLQPLQHCATTYPQSPALSDSRAPEESIRPSRLPESQSLNPKPKVTATVPKPTLTELWGFGSREVVVPFLVVL